MGQFRSVDVLKIFLVSVVVVISLFCFRCVTSWSDPLRLFNCYVLSPAPKSLEDLKVVEDGDIREGGVMFQFKLNETDFNSLINGKDFYYEKWPPEAFDDVMQRLSEPNDWHELVESKGWVDLDHAEGVNVYSAIREKRLDGRDYNERLCKNVARWKNGIVICYVYWYHVGR